MSVAGDDVAPLVAAAHLQRHAVAVVELGEIVRLQTHVVELEKGKLLLAGQSELDRIQGQHAIDGEMAPDLAQEINVVEFGEPICVVGHDRVVLAVAEADETGEGSAYARLVGLDLGDRQKLAAFLLPLRHAHKRCHAAQHTHARSPPPLTHIQDPSRHE